MILKKNKNSANTSYSKVFLLIFYSLLIFLIGFFSQRFGVYGNIIEPYLFNKKKEFRIFTNEMPLETISLNISFENLSRLKSVKDDALEVGYLMNNEEFVAAKLNYNDEDFRIKLRLKGDNVSHIKNEKWSYRIKIDDEKTLFGMKKFSLHHPKERDYLNEWIFHKFMYQEDIISLRYKFINVRINGIDNGIYALEEHFDQILIDNNNRRSGLIFKYDEDFFWEELSEFDNDFFSNNSSGYGSHLSSKIEVFESKSVDSDKILKFQYRLGAKLLFEFRNGSKNTTEVFDIEKLSSFLALNDILQSHHSADWHNLRFYFNPITYLFEPIAFDGNPRFGTFISCNPPTYLNSSYENYFKDKNFYKLYLKKLFKYTRTNYLKKSLESIQDDLNYNLKILNLEWPEYTFLPSYINQNMNFIRKILSPKKVLDANIIQNNKKLLEISIANMQLLPIENFFILTPDSMKIYPKNNIFLSGKKHDEHLNYKILKFNPLPAVFQTSINNIKIGCKILGLDKNYYGPLNDIDYVFFNIDSIIPKDSYNYKNFPFIYEIENNGFNEIKFKRGVHIIEKPIFFPANKRIVLSSGTSLNMVSDSFIRSRSPLFMHGEVKDPIEIFSNDKTGGGIIIEGSKKLSTMEYVNFYGLKNNVKTGITGSVTFYETAGEIKNCTFENNNYEDALNIIRSTFKIEKCKFIDNQSDALDIDFSKGKIKDCYFLNSINDAVDFSGSIIQLKNIYIAHAGDKGISIGEKTSLRGSHIKIKNAKIAIASKDLSEVYIDEFDIINSKIGAAVYRKKEEYGPANMTLSNVSFTSCDQEYLLEKNSKLTINDELKTYNSNYYNNIILK